MGQIRLPVVVLLFLFVFVFHRVAAKAGSATGLRRQKREWVIPPVPLRENHDYSHREFIAKIRSDTEFKEEVRYFLEGKGADQDPVGVFIVDHVTGFLRVTQVLDREEIAFYNLSGIAKYLNGKPAEKNLDLRIKVQDENDCPPVFGKIPPRAINESSPKGTYIMKITATDNDEPGNLNSKIRYTLVGQMPEGKEMFSITPQGELFVLEPTLDRETQDTYTLTIKGTDLDGAVTGNTGLGTVVVQILDINDNLPVLEKDSYEGSILENTANVEVMRFKAIDADLINTDNWLAEYEIVSGNEAGYFSIETDPKTNEGVLILNKAVDYEELQELDLKVIVANKAPFYGPGSGTGVNVGTASSEGVSTLWTGQRKTYPVKINVKNQPEGPMFRPKIKAIPISEDSKKISLNSVIAKYPAIDEDTRKPAENVRYAKGYDPDSWITIDEKTAEIKLNKVPDRESKRLVNGTYTAKILCLTQDVPSKTSTGTIAIQVEDFNDHCPELTSTSQTMCTDDQTLFVTARDEDADPNGAPFVFNIIPESAKEHWKVERLNDTTAILRTQKPLWPGPHEVSLEIKDQQGQACPDKQVVKVEACTCTRDKVCNSLARESKGATFGSAGIGLLLLGLLLLLLVPLLLLFCTCGSAAAGGIGGGFTDIPFDTKEHLIAYHTEGQGEDKAIPLIHASVDLDNGVGKGSVAGLAAGGGLQSSSTMMYGGASSVFHANEAMETDYFSQKEKDQASFFHSNITGDIYDGIALPDHYLEEYYLQKVGSMAGNEAVKGDLLAFSFEGQGSPVGSVGCCSLLETDNDLEFLNNLDPKFRTLAEICRGEELKSEMFVPPPQRPRPERTTVKSVVTDGAVNVSSLPQSSSHVEKHVVTETSHIGTLSSAAVSENAVIQNQAYLIQQPVYYATTPVLQTTQYVMEPQLQNTVLVSDLPAVSNMQTMYVVDGVPGPESVVVKERVVAGPAVGGLIQSSTGSSHVVREGLAGVNSGLVGMKNLYGPQNLVLVEEAGSRGRIRQNVVMQNMSGSQNILLVEGQAGSGQVRSGGSLEVLQGCQERGLVTDRQNVFLTSRTVPTETAPNENRGSDSLLVM